MKIRSAVVTLVTIAAVSAAASGCSHVASGSSDETGVPKVARSTKLIQPLTVVPAVTDPTATVTPTTATVSPTTAPPTTEAITQATTPTTAVTGSSPPTSSPASHGAITSPPLPTPGPGFNEGQVTAVGDSVMIDYEAVLQQEIPGINVQSVVGEQWSTGEAELQQLKSEGQLGSVVVVGLSTNGPISSTDFANMMGILAGASRVVFVTVHVDRPWQDPNNAVLTAGVAQYHNTVLADWNTLADQNPEWLYSDDTHLPIDGPGATALAALVAAKV
jgi:hypothetical protein